MKKSTKAELNKYLKELNKSGLEKEVKKLYTKFKEVKQYYELEFSEDTTVILEEYKSQIRKEYFPSRGYGRGRSRESRKVITAFKKISIFPKDVIELLLYRVSVMIEYTSNYGDIDEAFYNSLGSSYEEACKMIKRESLVKEYRTYCRQLLNETYHFGWGLYDDLKSSYSGYLE